MTEPQDRRHLESQHSPESANRYRELRRVEEDLFLVSGAGHVPEWMSNYLGDIRGMRVLDIGCGSGRILKGFDDAGASVALGVDLDSEAVEVARRAGLNVELGDVADLGDRLAKSAPFDVVIMTHIIEHLPRDSVSAMLMTIRNLLRPGGCVLISTPNGQSPTGVYWLTEDATHTWLYTSGSLFYYLGDAGFDDFEVLDVYGLTDLKSKFNRLLRKGGLKLYGGGIHLRNRVLGMKWHEPSETVFTWEIKVAARRPLD